MITKTQVETVNPVNVYHKSLQQAQSQQPPVLSSMHDTYRTGRFYKKTWCNR